MSRPIHDKHALDAMDSSVDFDCCRICRGEQTPQDPLFHPCKCSGSIKFVHQPCLLDWLSLSKKKHCDLCKMPYRFAKFYDPNMPQQLPVGVLAKYIVKLAIEKGLVALRLGIVGGVWLVVVPIFTRWSWSFLFWVSEEGLVSSTRAVSANISSHIPAASGPHPNSSLLSAAGMSLLQAVGLSESSSRYDAPAGADARVRATRTLLPPWLSNVPASSWLSDVPVLSSLTRSTPVNQLIVYCIEGLAITAVIVISFILIILVRDYVLQHQRDPEPAAFEFVFDDDDINFEELTDDLFAQDYAVAGSDDQDWVSDVASEHELEDSIQAVVNATDAGDADTDDMVQEFIRIWRQAGGDPNRVVAIARDEGLQDLLRPWLERINPTVAHTPDDAPLAGPSTESLAGPPSAQSDDGTVATSLSTTTIDINELPASASDLVARDGVEANGTALFEFEYRPRASTGPMTTAGNNSLGSNYWDFAEPSNKSHAEPAADQGQEVQNTADRANEDDEEEWEDYTDADMSDVEMYPTVPYGVVFDYRPDELPPPLPGLERHDSANGSDVGRDAETAADAMSEDDDAAPPALAHQPALQPQPQGVIDNIANFMWQGLDDIAIEDLPPLIAPDEPGHALLDEMLGDEPLDDDVLPAGEADGQPPEDGAMGFDDDQLPFDDGDGDDFEGMMELVGMNGPLLALFQNAMFCLFLVVVTLLLGTFLPYNVGRITTWLVANPTQPILVLFSISRIIQDAGAIVLGVAAFVTLLFLNGIVQILQFVGIHAFANVLDAAKDDVCRLVMESTVRFADNFSLDALITPTGEIRNFSAISHEALITLKDYWSGAMGVVGRAIYTVYSGQFRAMAYGIVGAVTAAAATARSLAASLPSSLTNPATWVIRFETGDGISANPELAYWGGTDRFLASMLGFTTVFFIGWWYVSSTRTVAANDDRHEWEMAIVDVLTQAGGILKVTFIIGIEMFVFPVYSGFVLDLALLPLFESATMASRLAFLARFPLTSLFMHWFVGTTYMFHFSLFVYMCRKFLRKGLLYFLRDPEHNPVRDALDRSVLSHLSKILRSAYTYGVMIVVVIGGVVWGLSYTPGLSAILPIHYSSNEAVLAFPTDLMLYLVLMPAAVKLFKMYDAIHDLYEWWFRRAARALRLSWYIFGQRRIDEEGALQLGAEARDRPYPWLLTRLLAYDSASKAVHPVLLRPSSADAGAADNTQEAKRALVQSGQLVPDGWFARAPALDHIKIPKKNRVLLRVTEDNVRRDNRAAANDIYNSDQYTLVYLPPHFQVRYRIFLAATWTFVTMSCVVGALGPLVLGRGIFSLVVPAGVRYNDIYAFNVGVYSMAAVGYVMSCARRMQHTTGGTSPRTVRHVLATLAPSNLRRVRVGVGRAAAIVYCYFFIMGVVPLVLAALTELYVHIPLHTYMHPPQVSRGGSCGTDDADDAARHTVHVREIWVLGLMFMKLTLRYISNNHPDSRLASSIRAVFRHGAWRPDVGILTRAFVVPGTVLATAAFGLPLAMANVLAAAGEPACLRVLDALLATTTDTVVLRRFCYPLAAVLVVGLCRLWIVQSNFKSWQVRVRDEVYLIGTRLQNFGPPAVVQMKRIAPMGDFV